MTSQTPEKSPSRKQRLQEKQRRQLAVVDTIDKAEAKLRKAEAELAEAVAEAVEVFGSEQGASEELGLSVEAIRGFLSLVEGGASGAEEPDGAAETAETAPAASPAESPAKARTEAKTAPRAETKPEREPVAV
ncbi:hypothetical protein ACFRKB_20535 [Streptomyces scopuliridis]|uniref:hypothetical protein n=1 Tax=Streptomyces scopuliridis TaxID=452529 RepID=UPI0036B61C46